MLRSSGDFVRYALSVVVQKIQQLEETGHTDGPDGQNADRTFRFLCDMTRLKNKTKISLVWLLVLFFLFSGKSGESKSFFSKCLSSVLMWRYTNIPSVVEEAGKREKRSSLSQLCLEGLLRIFTTCQQRFPDKMVHLLSAMGPTCTVKAAKFPTEQ